MGDSVEIDFLFDLLLINGVLKELNLWEHRVKHSKNERQQNGDCLGELDLAFLHVFASRFLLTRLMKIYSKVRTPPRTLVATLKLSPQSENCGFLSLSFLACLLLHC